MRCIGIFGPALLLLAPLLLRAQEPPASDPVLLERRAVEKLSRLTETLSDISARLKAADPAKSRLARAALKYLGEKGVEDEMKAALEDMTRGKWQNALDRMDKIQKDLAALLDLLLDRNKQLLDLLEKIQDLENLRKELKDILGEQEAERDQARRTAGLKDLGERLEAAARRLAGLEKEQRDLLGRLPAGPAGKLAPPQEALRRKTEAAAEELEKLEARARSALGEKPPAASSQVRLAARSMESAAKALEKSSPGRAGSSMEKAARRLKKAREALENLARRTRDKIHRLSLGEQARAQAATAARTRALAEKFRKGGKDLPGGKGVSQAVPFQEKAAGELGKGKARPALSDQEEALKNLKKGLQEAEEALRQARRRLQEELLRALQERIAGILARQKQVSAATRVLHARARGADPPPRAVRVRASKLSQTEGALAEEARRAVKILREEGTTVVLPEILDTVKRYLLYLKEDLGKGRTGPPVQARQAEVENLLSAALEALKREQEKRDDQESSSNDRQPPRNQPLVDRRAELKMIRLLQQDVYEATLRAKILSEKDPASAGREAERLAPRQRKIYELTRKLADRIQKDLAEEEEGK